MICTRCGYDYDASPPSQDKETAVPACPLCEDGWDIWELRIAPIPLMRNREQIGSWLAQLPYPSSIDLVATSKGLRVRMYTPSGKADGAVNAWAAMNHHQTRWERIGTAKKLDVKIVDGVIQEKSSKTDEFVAVLKTNAKIVSIALSETGGDPILALAGQLLNGISAGQERGLRIWIVGKDPALQARLRALSAYSYGTESGVGNDTPNPWGMQLALVAGMMIASISAGLFAVGWFPFLDLIGIVAGGDFSRGSRAGHEGLVGMALDP